MKKTSFRQDRPTLITGATGLPGGWLVKHLIAAGADIVCLVRDWVPNSELVRANLVEQVKVVRGDICDQELIERTLAEKVVDNPKLHGQAFYFSNDTPVSVVEIVEHILKLMRSGLKPIAGVLLKYSTPTRAVSSRVKPLPGY